MLNFTLLVRFLQIYAFQPATAFWRAIEVDILRHYIPQSGTILDLGCGDGKLTMVLFEQNKPLSPDFVLIGIDGDADEVLQASKTFIYNRLHTCRASDVPEDSATLDAVISNSVLEHITDIEETLAEVARLLKPGGKLIFTVPSPGFHDCLSGPLLPWVSRRTYLEELDKRLIHYRYWSPAEWQNHLEKHKLRIKAKVEYLACPEVRRWESISRLTAGVLYFLSRRKKTPFQVQKNLGLRALQNSVTLPYWFAWLLGKFITIGLDQTKDKKYGAVLIEAQKME